MVFEEEGFVQIHSLPCAVYVLKHKETDSVYVGSTKDLSNRLSGHFKHLENNKHVNKQLQAAFAESPVFDVFCKFTINREEAYSEEQRLVDRLRNSGKLLNIVLDDVRSSKGRTLSDEAKQVIGDKNRGRARPPRSAEHRANLSLSHKNRIYPPIPPERMKALHENNRGKKRTEEQKSRMREAQLGVAKGQFTTVIGPDDSL